MLSDLIQALPAAVLVCVVPGYFWAAALIPPGDHAERLAYSVALSITLVPVVALAQVRLLDTGVTLAIAVISVAVVFVAGLGVYLWFGTTERVAGPLLPLYGAPLNVLALVALSLALGVGAVISSGGSLLPAAAVALLAGVLGALGRRGGAPARESLRVSDGSSPARYITLGVVGALALARGYLGPVIHDWPYLRGADHFSHAVMANQMLSEGSYESYLVYPPGFHTLVAGISRLSGLPPLELFPVLAPAMLVLPAIACYALAGRLWGWPCGVAAAAFAGLLLVGPYQSFADGRYPNFVSAKFLLVVAVAALILLYYAPSLRSALLLGVLGSSLVLYHPVASLYLALLLSPVAVLVLPYLLLRSGRGIGWALLVSLTLLGSLSFLYAWDTYDLPALISGLGDSGTGKGAIEMVIGTQPAQSLGHLVEVTSQPVAWLGLMGLILVAAGRSWRTGMPEVLTRVTLLLWALVLFVGSRTTYSGFPQRFEGDLGLPLTILAALAFVALLYSLRSPSPPGRPVAFAAVSLVAVVVAFQAGQNLQQALPPANDVPEPEVVAAGRWLREHNGGGSVISTPYLGSGVSNRAVLAMGGYTGLQSYPRRNMESPRSLPPSGMATIKASWWVLHHPQGERTEQLLKKYDIRYVVLYKSYPGVSWRAFADGSDLYREVFENGSVVVFEVGVS